jgi:hypothetical protein
MYIKQAQCFVPILDYVLYDLMDPMVDVRHLQGVQRCTNLLSLSLSPSKVSRTFANHNIMHWLIHMHARMQALS